MIEDIYEKYGELVSIPSSNQLKREFRSYNLVYREHHGHED